MGFSQFISRYPKPVSNLSFSSVKTIQSILKSPSFPSLLPNPEKGPPQFLPSSPPYKKDPTFTHKTHQKPFWALPNHHFRSIHVTLAKPHVSTSSQVAEDSTKLCRILSNHASNPLGVESSLACSGVSLCPALVEEVLKKLSNAGALALLFFRWSEKQNGFSHTTESYNSLIEALGKIKQFKMIWNLVGSMKSKGLLTRDTFALIMRRYARARLINEAVEMLDKMEKFGMRPELSDFNRLIDTLSKSRHVKEAQEVFDEMKKNKRFTPDLKSYTILLEGWGKEQQIRLLEEVYREMRDEGFEPDAVTYGILIDVYCKSRKCDEAVEMFHEMEEKKCKPTPHVYCSLINGLGAELRLSEALQFFAQFKDSGFVPEIQTYNAVVGSYCWSKQFTDAYRVIDEMKQCGLNPNSRTYDIILHNLIKSRRTEEAYSIFQDMGSKFECEPSLSTYIIMICMFCNEERVDMALKVCDQMKGRGILPSMHIFSSLINGLCNQNRLDDASKYFQEMLDMGIRPPGKLYGNLKQALLGAGKKDLAIKLSQKLAKIRRTPMDG